jgi:hypothetical protein
MESEQLHHLEKLRLELCQALGEAVWAFSMIEGLTYSYLRRLSSEPLHLLMGDQGFGARIKLIRHLVKRLSGQDEEKQRVQGYLNRAEELSRTRNLIAHNPWRIWIDFEASDFRTEIQKFTDETKKLDLSALREFTRDAQELASSLEHMLGALKFAS